MDSRHWVGAIDSSSIIEIPPIKELCKTLETKFLRQEEEIAKIREENKKLKEEVWKEEEMARLKQRMNFIKKKEDVVL